MSPPVASASTAASIGESAADSTDADANTVRSTAFDGIGSQMLNFSSSFGSCTGFAM